MHTSSTAGSSGLARRGAARPDATAHPLFELHVRLSYGSRVHSSFRCYCGYLPDNAKRVQKGNGMNAGQNVFIKLHAIIVGIPAQEFTALLSDTPVFIIDDVRKDLQERKGRIRMSEPSSVVAPIAAMQILDDVQPAIFESRKVS